MAEIFDIGRLRVATETTYGADLTGTIASFADIRASGPPEWMPGRKMLRDDRLRQRSTQEPLDVVGPQECMLKWGQPLGVTESALDAAASAPSSPRQAFGRVLRAILGGYTASQGSTVVSSTNGSLTATATHGSRFTKGQIVGVTVDGQYQAAQVINLSSDTLTLSNQTVNSAGAATAASASAVIYGSETYFLAPTPGNSIQAIIEAKDRDAIWAGMGMNGSFGVELPHNEIAKLSFDLKGTKWRHDDELAGPLGGSSIASATHTDGASIYTHGFVTVCRLGVSPTPGVAVPTFRTCASSIGLEFSFGNEQTACVSAVETGGFDSWIRTLSGGPAVTATLLFPFEDEAFFDDRDLRAQYSVGIQVGSSPGRTWFLYLPATQIIASTPGKDTSKLYGIEVKFKSLEPALISSPSTDIHYSPFIMAHL